jgi:hypothetical protein
MATIAIQGGKVITKEGKVSCSCCGPPMIIFYSYDIDPSLGKGWEDCPDAREPCGSAETGSCSGATISGFIYSDPWPSILIGKTPKAKIYAYACMDNWGNIGSAFSDNQGTDDCVLGYTYYDVIDTVEIDPDKRMKIPFSVTNAEHGGPYGICGATIEWYWE